MNVGTGVSSFTLPRWIARFVGRDLSRRNEAVDVVRGLAIIAMILVNHVPPAAPVYAPFVHPPWTGWRLADTIFPTFLFVVGVSIRLALGPSGGARQGGTGVHARIFRRALTLLVLNVLLINFPYYQLGRLQVSGTLAHIAWCYLFASLIHLHANARQLPVIVVAILLLQWALLALVEVPGFGAGVLTPDGNASRYLDELLFGSFAARLRGEGVTTSGVAVTAAATATTLIGVIAGNWLQSDRAPAAKTAGLLVAGVALCLLGQAWSLVLPVSKPLWTASYVALMGGISLVLLGAVQWLMEIRGYKGWALPLRIAGVNALFFYVLAQALQRVLVYGRVQGSDGAPQRLRFWLYEHLIVPWGPGEFGSLVYSLAFLLVCYAIVAALYRWRLFIKL